MKNEVRINLLHGESQSYSLLYFRYNIKNETILFMIMDKFEKVHVGYMEEIWGIKETLSWDEANMPTKKDGITITMNEKEIVFRLDSTEVSCSLNSLEIGDRKMVSKKSIYQKLKSFFKNDSSEKEEFQYNVSFDCLLCRYAIHTRYFVFDETVWIQNGTIKRDDR